MALEQPGDAAFWCNVDVVCRGNLRQSGHRHDIAADRDDEFRARRQPHLANRNHVILRRALQVGIG